jgi:hypothetical protein
MRFSRPFGFSLPVMSALVIGAALGLAQAEQKSKFEPRVGQPGKDVIWVPTAQTLVDKMLDMAQVGRGSIHFDLGSGDGRTVITAAQRGATAFGVEYNPEMVNLSRENAKQAGVTERATFIEGDLFQADISKATSISLFLLPSINLKLRPKILELRPGTRIVSNSFNMGDWEPEQTVQAPDDCRTYCRAHLWIVPAQVTGTWKLPDGELRLQQDYQMLHGTLTVGNSRMTINDGRMTGDMISFLAGGSRYTGRVNGNSIEGFAQTSSGWRASR